ncbi:hypothetical protein CMK11_05655 [Candidatus Poribacteria bacterium]|nr:hypothetical protein [Candidatus Poribacteria bacterium]
MIAVAAIAWLPILLAGVRVYAPFAGAGPVTCALRIVGGVPCPGCGMTRGLGELLHGRLTTSWRYHPLALPTLALMVGVWAYGVLAAYRPVRSISPAFALAALVPVASIFMLVWVARLWLFARAGGIPPEFARPTWGG